MSEGEQRLFTSGGSARAIEPTTSDRRLLKGARSRQTVLRHAVDLASLEGLAGLSLGRLASDLGISKSGVQTLFGTKENLQNGAVEYARDVFNEVVVRPAMSAPPGAVRLRALVESWIEYATAPLFPGGCFWAANLADFDSRPGPVRDALFRCQSDWRILLANELRHASDSGEVAELDAELAAFQVDAVLLAANTALRVGADSAEEVVSRVRRIREQLLTSPR
ncbi:TetR/AcrR family transcriptional regulator [Streptomyces sp. NPDC005551]|uniref:TetR/AcrR family transcriptional regulator n=1 Tax=unclassified Streptomyces TaxID=2593676 RepID=UPI0033E4312E